jgi:hypothetical protein
MRNTDNRRSPRAKFGLQYALDQAVGRGVDRGGSLIQNEELGPARQRANERNCERQRSMSFRNGVD